MPIFGQEIFDQAQAKGPLTDAAYLKARDNARRLAGKEGLLAALDKDNLDAVIAPSMSPAWLTDPINGDHFTGAGYGMAAVAGTPSITVPSGDVHGLPLGLTFMGRPYSEPELIGFAYAFEQATKARKAPEFKADGRRTECPNRKRASLARSLRSIRRKFRRSGPSCDRRSAH